MCGNSSCKSLAEALCKIVKLQKQGECLDKGTMSCDRPFLGGNSSTLYNTRPITLYTCPGNTLWSMPYTLNDNTGNSTVFRVEQVEDCCATFRVLINNSDEYTASDTFFTINLNCVGAIQCLADTYISCIN